MRIREFRVVLPLTLGEFEIGARYTEVQLTREGRSGLVLRDAPFHDVELLNGLRFSGQYMHKRYDLESQIFGLPSGLRTFDEHCWRARANGHVYMRTELTNAKRNFVVRIDTLLCENNRGDTANALNLPSKSLRNRSVVNIDIANVKKHPDKDYFRNVKMPYPADFYCKPAKRGRLRRNWRGSCLPVMCSYKVVTVDFDMCCSSLIEKYFLRSFPRTIGSFHRRVFCTMDEWYGLNLPQIRQLEMEVISRKPCRTDATDDARNNP